jgi:hypothetical protein
VVNGGQAHGPQHPVGHGRRAWNLQEVATGGVKVEGQHAGAPKKFIFCIQNTLLDDRPWGVMVLTPVSNEIISDEWSQVCIDS